MPAIGQRTVGAGAGLVALVADGAAGAGVEQPGRRQGHRAVRRTAISDRPEVAEDVGQQVRAAVGVQPRRAVAAERRADQVRPGLPQRSSVEVARLRAAGRPATPCHAAVAVGLGRASGSARRRRAPAGAGSRPIAGQRHRDHRTGGRLVALFADHRPGPQVEHTQGVGGTKAELRADERRVSADAAAGADRRRRSPPRGSRGCRSPAAEHRRALPPSQVIAVAVDAAGVGGGLRGCRTCRDRPSPAWCRTRRCTRGHRSPATSSRRRGRCRRWSWPCRGGRTRSSSAPSPARRRPDRALWKNASTAASSWPSRSLCRPAWLACVSKSP